jgi:REP element-mobilizing transposase RayT
MVFVDDVDRAAFVRLLWQSTAQFRVSVHGWCLLGTHFHLICRCRQEELSLAMHRLNGLYAQNFNRRHGRRGHLFEERFSAWVLESDAHLHASIRYVIQNPVAAGLCREPRDWSWSWPRDERLSQWTGPPAGEGLSLGQDQSGLVAQARHIA